MIAYDELDITPELREKLSIFGQQVREFRQEGPLDDVALAKLDEHFKASHIYHSAGIEGNRLTLQETAIVLKDGLDISGKPFRDSVEVKLLGKAYDYLKTLSERNQTVREADIRSLHSLLIGDNPSVSPGQYRNTGVVISGSEHKPPEPLEVPKRMEDLVNWINANLDKDPIIVASIAHHELAAIHPFKDGNGRVSRLIMNLILLKGSYPICNIRREDRPDYYDALGFADVGLYDALMNLILTRSSDLFSEYVRIRTETKRMAEWAAKWGTKETEVLLKRESREMELWQSRIRQIFLEFQKAAELLDDKLENIELSFHDYNTEISFDKYQRLVEKGGIELANAFSITFFDKKQDTSERFMFRYYRNFAKFPWPSKIIPLELNYFDKDKSAYIRLSELGWASRIRIRDLYFTPDRGEFVVRYYDVNKKQEVESKGDTISAAVQWFYDDILRNVFQMS